MFRRISSNNKCNKFLCEPSVAVVASTVPSGSAKLPVIAPSDGDRDRGKSLTMVISLRLPPAAPQVGQSDKRMYTWLGSVREVDRVAKVEQSHVLHIDHPDMLLMSMTIRILSR